MSLRWASRRLTLGDIFPVSTANASEGIMDGLVRSSSVSKTTCPFSRSGGYVVGDRAVLSTNQPLDRLSRLGICERHPSTDYTCVVRFFSFNCATHSDFHWESAGSAAARHVDDLM